MTAYWTRGNSSHLRETRNADRPRVTARYPTETDCTAPGCGFDEFTASAKRMDCPVCKGTGKVATWQTWMFRARVIWPGATQFSFFAPTPGVEVGDVLLVIATADVPLMERILNTEHAYLAVDGKTVRPTTIQKMDAPQIGEEYQIVCHLYSATA